MSLQQICGGYFAFGASPFSQSQNPSTGFMNMLMRYNQIEMQRYYDYDEYDPLYNDYDSSDNGTDINNNDSTSTSISGNGTNKKIAIVDYCDDSDADIDLDGDGVADMAHGNVVANLINASYGNADIYTFDITSDSSGSTAQKMVSNLKQIVSDLQSGKYDYDAVNLSLSSRISYSTLSSALGVTITKDNVDQYKDEIRNWLLTDGANNGYSTTAQVVQLLEQIEELGADVFVAAANVNDGTDDELNLYTIANNVTSVGALSSSGSKASFSFDNSLIDTWALGEIEVKKVKNSSGTLLGFDLNNDGVVDIDSSYASGGTTNNNNSNPFIRGTSFASPYRLMQALSS